MLTHGMSPIAAKTYTTEVICLRAIDFGEADKILHLYSPDVGRISAIAKGVKKQKSKLAGACELLNLSEVQLSKGKNLDVLCQYQPRETFVGIRGHLLKLAFALLTVELVNLVAAEYDSDSHDLFHSLKDGLEALDQAPEDDAAVTAAATRFQLQLLESAGYHPQLDRCIFSDQPLDWQEPFYCFSPQLGGVTLSETRKSQPHGSHGARWVNVSASTLAALAAPRTADWQAVNLLKTQKFLRYYFREVFEKELHAYELVFQLLEPAAPAPAGTE